ncbi:MAG: hypothetical protein JO167_06070 [Alphaproteobacteria bacterium]|nr:hypothetical protein [Alphaproteobacteria bacterium]MBV9905666.1 hypothetical protein [Alphaproteobacteria bacterium]
MGSQTRGGNHAPEQISAADSAGYTRDLLESLKKIAEGQGQSLLAHLLHMASTEAKYQSRQAQETPPPE